MKRAMQYSFIAIGLLLILGGCKTIRGGGWIDSKTNGEKATFGVNITCKNSEYSGQFTYHDHGYKYEKIDGEMVEVSLKGVVGPTELEYDGACDEYYRQEYTQYDFTYQVIPDKSDGEGWGIIQFQDADLNGAPGEKDHLKILIMEGPYVGYFNEGELGGGNLKIF